MSNYVASIVASVKERNPAEPEFHQAVEEVLPSLVPVIERRPDYRKAKILERMVEPERVVMFRVPWVDGRGEVQVNRGYRIQMSSAIGPLHHSSTTGVSSATTTSARGGKASSAARSV